jgi:cell shape-determining protein MreC
MSIEQHPTPRTDKVQAGAREFARRLVDTVHLARRLEKENRELRRRLAIVYDRASHDNERARAAVAAHLRDFEKPLDETLL